LRDVYKRQANNRWGKFNMLSLHAFNDLVLIGVPWDFVHQGLWKHRVARIIICQNFEGRQ
ncbi:MAG: hypothetical protein NWQ26_09080, partial [Paraglaciecola sp.]|nr:hypothetical protein [Paraglaciecola sp.]